MVRKPNGAEEASFCEDEFSFVFVEFPTDSFIILRRQSAVQVKMF